MAFWPSVVVATPAHSGVGATLTYRSELSLAPGTLVRVPLGAREVLGVVWECPTEPPEGLSEAQTRALKRRLAETRRSAEEDHLTGLPNRRAFEARYEAEYRAARAAAPPEDPTSGMTEFPYDWADE